MCGSCGAGLLELPASGCLGQVEAVTQHLRDTACQVSGCVDMTGPGQRRPAGVQSKLIFRPVSTSEQPTIRQLNPHPQASGQRFANRITSVHKRAANTKQPARLDSARRRPSCAMTDGPADVRRLPHQVRWCRVWARPNRASLTCPSSPPPPPLTATGGAKCGPHPPAPPIPVQALRLRHL
eukprot:357784-Chlamydomonas_euryale.AAC.2